MKTALDAGRLGRLVLASAYVKWHRTAQYYTGYRGSLVLDGPPLARLHALWTLHGTEQLDRDTVLAALGDKDERVAAAAIRLAEKWLHTPSDTQIYQAVIAVKADSSPALTLQLALSLGESPAPTALKDLAAIAVRAGTQPFVADAIVSGLAGREADFIRLVTVAGTPETVAPVVKLAASAVFKSGDAAHITSLLALLEPGATVPAWTRTAVLDGLERFLPKTPDGKPVAGNIAVEPRPLLLLSVQGGNTPEAKQAGRLSTLLKWPGKPGLEKESAEIAARLTPALKVLFGRAATSSPRSALPATRPAARAWPASPRSCFIPIGSNTPGLAPAWMESVGASLLATRNVRRRERARSHNMTAGISSCLDQMPRGLPRGSLLRAALIFFFSHFS